MAALASCQQRSRQLQGAPAPGGVHAEATQGGTDQRGPPFLLQPEAPQRHEPRAPQKRPRRDSCVDGALLYIPASKAGWLSSEEESQPGLAD